MNDQLRAEADAYLQRYIDSGWQLDHLLMSRGGAVSPGDPAVWIWVGGTLFKDRAGDECIRLKKHQIGVALYYKDGRAESAVFDVRELWRDIVDPQPKQLSFLDLVS